MQLLVSTTLMTFGALVLLLAPQDILCLSVSGECILALGMGLGNAAVYRLVPQTVPNAVGGAAGWAGGIGAFGGFAIPPMMGAFVSRYGTVGYSFGFSILVALACISFVLTVCLKFSNSQQP